MIRTHRVVNLLLSRDARHVTHTHLASVPLVQSAQEHNEQQVDKNQGGHCGHHVNVLHNLLADIVKHAAKVNGVGRHEEVDSKERQMVAVTHRGRAVTVVRYLDLQWVI